MVATSERVSTLISYLVMPDFGRTATVFYGTRAGVKHTVARVEPAGFWALGFACRVHAGNARNP